MAYAGIDKTASFTNNPSPGNKPSPSQWPDPKRKNLPILWSERKKIRPKNAFHFASGEKECTEIPLHSPGKIYRGASWIWVPGRPATFMNEKKGRKERSWGKKG